MFRMLLISKSISDNGYDGVFHDISSISLNCLNIHRLVRFRSVKSQARSSWPFERGSVWRRLDPWSRLSHWSHSLLPSGAIGGAMPARTRRAWNSDELSTVLYVWAVFKTPVGWCWWLVRGLYYPNLPNILIYIGDSSNPTPESPLPKMGGEFSTFFWRHGGLWMCRPLCRAPGEPRTGAACAHGAGMSPTGNAKKGWTKNTWDPQSTLAKLV